MKLFNIAYTGNISSFDIHFENVTFGYIRDKHVLNGISFYLKEQSTAALVGSSGSGKTTITRLIARLWDTKKGTIKIGRTNISRIPQQRLSDYIDCISHDVPLLDDSIYNNIKSGNPEACDDMIFEAAEKACVIDFAWELPEGLHTSIKDPDFRISDHEKLRIHIARALLKNAPIVLLDETTSAVAVKEDHYLQKAKQELTKGKTAIIITNNPETIKNADQVLVLNNGKLEEHANAVFYYNHTQPWNLKLEF